MSVNIGGLPSFWEDLSGDARRTSESLHPANISLDRYLRVGRDGLGMTIVVARGEERRRQGRRGEREERESWREQHWMRDVMSVRAAQLQSVWGVAYSDEMVQERRVMVDGRWGKGVFLGEKKRKKTATGLAHWAGRRQAVITNGKYLGYHVFWK
jgi:hypothetical protein